MKQSNGGTALNATVKWLALSLLCVGVASCSTSSGGKKRTTKSKEYFAESEYGVKASPRVSEGGPVRKGGGRFLLGKPYVVRGKTYVPKENPAYDKVGQASWYGSAFHGRLTANGEVYDQYHLSAAHPTMPLPSYARVTNVENGTSVIVRVNDRGPFHSGRLIDLSDKTAEMLDMKHSGTAKVRVQYVGPARMDGHDMPYLMASYNQKGDRFPRINPEGQIASGVMVASNAPVNGMPVPQANPMANPGTDQNSYPLAHPAAGQGAVVASIPVPMQNPSYQMSLNGPTPSQPYPAAAPMPLAAPMSAQAPVAGAVPMAPQAGGGMVGEFQMLPVVGPWPMERPDYSLRPSFASAYAEVGADDGSMVFEAILVRNDGLSEQSILSYAKRRGISASE